jgi:hypothetical protein
MSLGENVGKLVKARRVSYGDIARALGDETDPQAIWSLVKRKSRQSKFAGKLAAYFNVPLERLLADDFDPNEAMVAPPLQLKIEEAEALMRLRRAHPHWRRYVLGLAMVDSEQAQALMLTTMRQAVPDYKVEEAFGTAPHVRGDHELARVKDSQPSVGSIRKAKQKAR